ncbi:hypothetical protein CF335_g4245, partial [Tilletia laevis]
MLIPDDLIFLLFLDINIDIEDYQHWSSRTQGPSYSGAQKNHNDGSNRPGSSYTALRTTR